MNRVQDDPYAKKILQGEECFQMGRIDDALEAFESVLKKDSHHCEALNNKAALLNKLGETDEATRIFLKILQIQPGHPDGIFNLVSNYLSQSNWQMAEDVFSLYANSLPMEDAEALARDIVDFKFTLSEESNMLKSFPLTVNVNSKTHTLRLFLDTHKYSQKIMWDYLANGRTYEPETLEFLASVLKEGDCFIDIGAHIGYFTLMASKMVGPQGTVISVEPEISNTAHLGKHLSENDIENVVLINAAVGSETRNTAFYINSDNDGGHALWDSAINPLCEKTRQTGVVREVRMLTLDDIIRQANIDSVNAIKIDTEGAEKNVLEGGIQSLMTYDIPYIVCEINRFGLHQMGTNEKEFRDFMKDLGYDTYLMRTQNPHLTKLQPDQYVQSKYVFNVLFMK